ncbi:MULTISPECIES: PilW family protein [Luteimonas]|uniref:PilW family protein n=1 Tax=Luteimonas TaxID=83614 RepID=UPI000C7BBB16|nr:MULTISPECIES: PilW family protein [Luteimonas]
MNPQSRARSAGLSLIEILIALAIGSLLILALVQVFGASRTAYQLSTGLARTQENGRFAIDILQRDIRMAGHMGCVNDQSRFLPANVTASRPALISSFLTPDEQFGTGASPTSDYAAAPDALRFDLGIEGFNAVGTSSGNALALAAVPSLAADASAWEPALPATLYSDLVGDGTGPGVPVAGSDVIALRFFAPTGAQVTSFTPGANTVIQVDTMTQLMEGDANPGLFGIADCMQAGVFNASAVAGSNITVATGGLNESTFDTTPQFTVGQAMLYRAQSFVYYVGLNDFDNPALYRLRYRADPGGAIEVEREEMVEGVESLQLQFGQDSNTTTTGRPTGNIGASVVANALLPAGAANYDHAWRRVGMVQVGVVARSPDAAAASQREAGTMRLSALGVIMTPPEDTRYRAVYEDSIALRNRLFGN